MWIENASLPVWAWRAPRPHGEIAGARRRTIKEWGLDTEGFRALGKETGDALRCREEEKAAPLGVIHRQEAERGKKPSEWISSRVTFDLEIKESESGRKYIVAKARLAPRGFPQSAMVEQEEEGPSGYMAGGPNWAAPTLHGGQLRLALGLSALIVPNGEICAAGTERAFLQPGLYTEEQKQVITLPRETTGGKCERQWGQYPEGGVPGPKGDKWLLLTNLSICGLRDAAIRWYGTLRKTMATVKMKCAGACPCVYHLQDGQLGKAPEEACVRECGVAGLHVFGAILGAEKAQRGEILAGSQKTVRFGSIEPTHGSTVAYVGRQIRTLAGRHDGAFEMSSEEKFRELERMAVSAKPGEVFTPEDVSWCRPLKGTMIYIGLRRSGLAFRTRGTASGGDRRRKSGEDDAKVNKLAEEIEARSSIGAKWKAMKGDKAPQKSLMGCFSDATPAGYGGCISGITPASFGPNGKEYGLHLLGFPSCKVRRKFCAGKKEKAAKEATISESFSEAVAAVTGRSFSGPYGPEVQAAREGIGCMKVLQEEVKRVTGQALRIVSSPGMKMSNPGRAGSDLGALVGGYINGGLGGMIIRGAANVAGPLTKNATKRKLEKLRRLAQGEIQIENGEVVHPREYLLPKQA